MPDQKVKVIKQFARPGKLFKKDAEEVMDEAAAKLMAAAGKVQILGPVEVPAAPASQASASAEHTGE